MQRVEGYPPKKGGGFFRWLFYTMGCAISPIVGCIGAILALFLLLLVFVDAVLGFFNPFAPSIGGNYTPPVGPAAPPIYGTPPRYVPPTVAPTRTPMPPAPTPWTLPDCVIATPDPAETPDPTATAQAYQDCEDRHARADATSTAAYIAWAATATAYPTETPPPPTPEGGGPRGWPISQACDDTTYTGCAADVNGNRMITQGYGCTAFPEVLRGWSRWCQDNTNQHDPRWNRDGPAPPPPPQCADGYCTGHEGMDFDTGHYLDQSGNYYGEPLYSTVIGQVAFVNIVVEGHAGWNVNFGTTIWLEDASHQFLVIYGHMSRIAPAYYLGPVPNPQGYQYGQALGRPWQAGDPIVIDGPQGRVLLGLTGYTGYTNRGAPMPGGGSSDGEHLHFQINYQGISVDPWPYIMRGVSDPLPPIPPPYRRPGG